MATSDTERIRACYNRDAQQYDRGMQFFERLFFSGGREWVCAQAHGDVLEIAAGTGRNFPFYGRDVRLSAIELSPAMADIAGRRAAALDRQVDLRIGNAEDLEFPDASFDAVVCTLSLCTIPDDRRAIGEVKRVLRPGGCFLLLEHVRSPAVVVRLLQRVLDPLAVRSAGDHLLREPLEHLRAYGFKIERLERSKWGFVERVNARKAI